SASSALLYRSSIPHSSAALSRSLLRSTIVTDAAPARVASWAMRSPIVPAPTTRTWSPKRRGRMSHPRIAHASGSMRDASLRSVSSLSLYTLVDGAVKNCWAAPSDATTPSPFHCRHRFCLPLRQNSHSPHVVLGFTATL